MKDLKAVLENEFYPYVQKPARYLGNEYNIVLKNLEEVQLRVALCFPDVYELGMSHVGFEILYYILNKQPHVWAERVYAPWVDAETIMREKHIPLFSLESKTPLHQFHLIGFTLQYELTYTNILNMLDLGGIPLRSQDRQDSHPLVIAGGPLATNPEPIAPFMDAVLVGDGEEAIVEISQLLMQARQENWPRPQILSSLSKIQGMYVPALYRPIYTQSGVFERLEKLDPEAPNKIQKRVLPELNKENYPVKPLVPVMGITHDRLSVEIMRGCTEGCRFCSAGMVYRPVRQRPASDIVKQTEQALRSTGYDEIGLLSLNTSDYDQLQWLMSKEKALVENKRVRFSFPSLRLDNISLDMVQFASMVKKSGFTFAPEAGSQRLRNVINKNIREEDIFSTLEMVLENGWQLVKFYFMVGLPTEKEEDVLAIVDLMKKVLTFSKQFGSVRFHLGLSPFSPKPHTPFQWERQEPPERLNEKIQRILKGLSDSRIQISWRDPYMVTVETVIARGDRNIANAIEAAFRAGARFDGWKDQFNWERWAQAFQATGINWQQRLEAISTTLPLPWDHIDIGVLRSYLNRERMRAYQAQVSPDCKDHVCLGCGLQRKTFEAYVSCYKRFKKGETGAAGVMVRAGTQGGAAHSTSSTVTTVEQPVRFGRRSKRRIKPTAPIKKRIRIRYSKMGHARFIPHLDIIRVFDRAARRANIPLVYTQGYNPHPKISFGPPLALGVASIAEYLDMEVEIGREADIQSRFNQYLPEGMKILQYKAIYSKVPALAAIINRSSYELFIGDHRIPEAWLQEWMSQTSVWVTREVKEEVREVDIRPYVSRMELSGNKLLVEVDVIEGRTARITEVLESVLAPHGVDYRKFPVQRTGQYIVDGSAIYTPFDVI